MSPTGEPRIAVVCGGTSAEAEVSRSSGQGVAEALAKRFADVKVIEFDAKVGEALLDAKVDVVYPVLHGPPGEDGTFQGYLEIVGLPYVGCAVQASACAMDKTVAKRIFQATGLRVAPDVVVSRSQGTEAATRQALEGLGESVVVKPSAQGSALGVRLATGATEIDAALQEAFKLDGRVLVEKRIEGREITCGLLERDGLEVLPVVEVRTPENTWYDFEHRYAPGKSEHLIPAPLPEDQYKRVQEMAKAAFIALGCRDLSRVDFVVPESGEPVILEVNTLPGMTPTSLYPDSANSYGVPFEDLVEHLIRRALSRKSS